MRNPYDPFSDMMLNIQDVGQSQAERDRRLAEQLASYKALLEERKNEELAEKQKKLDEQLIIATEEKRAALRKQFAEEEAKAQDELNKKAAKFEQELLKTKKSTQQQIADMEKKAQKAAAQERLAQAKEAADEILAASDEAIAMQRIELEKGHNTFLKSFGGLNSVLAANGRSVAANIASALSKAAEKFQSGAETYMKTYAKYMGPVSARLQGSGVGFTEIERKLSENTALNSMVQYGKIMEKVNELVEAGITDNVLQRAFLGEISDKIATTFDATQASLLQIGRLQQADTTAERLGLEANLTYLFNQYFGDTSYLSNQFDQVQETLLGVSSQLDVGGSLELEYVVQKWLGALTAVGATSSTVANIAKGLSYLGTGNITALSSDSALQNLFMLAINRAGNAINFNDIMSRGISASEANTLLYNLIEYMQGITGSNVVKSQFANILGVSLQDLRAFQNLSGSMEDLYGKTLTRGGMADELQSQLGQAFKRTHISEHIENIMQNVLAAAGAGVASAPALYATYRAADLLESLTGGIMLPTVFGSGLNMSVESIAKTGILGIPLMTSMITSALSGGLLSPFNLSAWEIKSAGGRGFASGFLGDQSYLRTTSRISMASSPSSTGAAQSLVDQQNETATTISGTEETDSDRLLNLIELISDQLNGVLKVSIEKIAPEVSIQGGSLGGI